MSWIGAFDMAGNVREWMFNAVGDQHFILGGGWSDPLYLAGNTGYTQPPFDRSLINGFRLAITRDPAAVAALTRRPRPEAIVRDFRAEPRVSDEVFAAYRRLYAYDASPLDARIEESAESPHWTRHRISFNAAYPGERVPLYLYLPRSGKPPFQTVLFWPGSGVHFLNSIDNDPVHLDFVVKSGRAVALPVFRGTFDRRDPPGASSTLSFRDQIIREVNDVRRSLDYLVSRTDIDAEAIVYYGYSWGGAYAPNALALEPRLRAAVLYVAEVDPFCYAPRVRVPVLMLNGEFDNVFPIETSARPFFELLGTPELDKKFVVTPGGHFVPREILIRETLDWLDHYLGRPAR